MSGPCAKKVVTCTIVSVDGHHFVGSNECEKPQRFCPRQAGEGYEKCQTVCRQFGHAEVVALNAAGFFAKGGHAYIEGIDHACKPCQQVLVRSGVRTITFGAAPK